VLYRDDINTEKQIVMYKDSVADYEVYENRWHMEYHKDEDNESDDEDNTKEAIIKLNQEEHDDFLHLVSISVPEDKKYLKHAIIKNYRSQSMRRCDAEDALWNLHADSDKEQKIKEIRKK